VLTGAPTRAAKLREKSYKLFDALRLYFEVAPTGSKLWRLKYRHAGREYLQAVVREWLALQQKKLAPSTFAKAGWTFETLLFPYSGSRSVAKLSAVDVLKVLKRIEGRGIHETAHRQRQRCAVP
jgi:3-oxoacyl-ACP reductase-like protein